MDAVSADLRSLSAKGVGYRPSVSLVLPAYNEEDTIAQAVQEAVDALTGLVDDFEVLVVDDGCTDRTAEIVTELARRLPQVRLLQQPRNMGYGAALRRGFSAATKDLVGFTDSDCQFNLNELNRLIGLARDYQIVTGYRIDRQDPWLRKVYSATYNVMVRALLGTRVRDCDCALKLFHREILPSLPITTDGFLINGEMLARARQLEYSIVEVGVSHRPRAAGESKVSITHIPIVLVALVRFWWNGVMFRSAQPADASSWPATRRSGMTLLLLVVATLLLLVKLNYSLIEPDEARYAQIALEMVESGDWLTPRLNGEPYLDKPPLLYWLTAASFEAFGFNERSARLPCAAAAWLTVICTYFLGRRLVGDRAAWVGALMLALSVGFVLAGRFLIMDSPLTLFTTVGFLASLIALQNRERAWTWWTLAGIACGLGVMTKGPVAPVLCLPPVVALAWLTRNRSILSWKNLLAVAVPTVLIALPWFLMIAEAQSEFVGHFFWKHNFQRFVNAFNHAQPWWFYLPVIALGMLPGTLLTPALAVYLGRKSEQASLLRTRELGGLLLSACWVVGFFSLSSCKLPTYILPAMPLLGLVLGKLLTDVGFARVTSPSEELSDLVEAYISRAFRQAAALGPFVGLLAIGAWMGFAPRSWPFALAALLVASVLWAQMKSASHASPMRFVALTATCSVVVTMLGFAAVVPEFADWRSISLSAQRVNERLGANTPIVFFGRPSQAAKLAIEDGIAEFSAAQVADFASFLDTHEQAVVVATGEDLEVLKESCGPMAEFAGPEARDRVYVAKRIPSISRLPQSGSSPK